MCWKMGVLKTLNEMNSDPEIGSWHDEIPAIKEIVLRLHGRKQKVAVVLDKLAKEKQLKVYCA